MSDNTWGEYTPWFKRPTNNNLSETSMESYDITDQVMDRLEVLAERIAYLKSIGDEKSAAVLIQSGEQMADQADSQEEWIILDIRTES